jgi:Ca-activated chloride channel family protein
MLSLSFMILALSRPQIGVSQQEIKSEGIELMLVIDVSNSMMAEDVRPNRLEQVKHEFSKLIDQLPGAKIGVIAFAGSAALLSPLTTDPNALKMYLDSLSPDSVSSQGTNFKAALEEAQESFKRGGAQKDETTRVTRVILIASDGEDNEQGALDFAKELSKDGTRIFTLAYGTEKGAPIPDRDQMGFLRGYKKDKAAQTILTTVKGDALQTLANAGNGSFYFGVFAGNHIEKLIADFDKLEKAQFETKVATQYDERYQWFLFLAFVLLLIEMSLGERKPRGRYRGRLEASV